MKKSLLLLLMVAICTLVALASYAAHAASPVAASAAAGTTAADSKAGNAVTIDNFSFAPAAITVPAGTTVRWTNKDDIPHTVVETDKKFRSKALDTDDSYSFTFTVPGTFDYFCSLHSKMTGKIVVN